MPTSNRDVFNEKPATDELVAADGGEAGPAAVLPRGAVVHTTRGDIWIKLFPDECPKTVENFTTHARNGYYDGVIVHRVIKGFMIQTGDPLGARAAGIKCRGDSPLKVLACASALTTTAICTTVHECAGQRGLARATHPKCCMHSGWWLCDDVS